MFCPNCGSSMKDGMKFCPNCGSAVAQEVNPVETAGPETTTPPEPEKTFAPEPKPEPEIAAPAEQTPPTGTEPKTGAYTEPAARTPQQPTYPASQQTYQAPQQPYQAPQQTYQPPQQQAYQAPQQPYQAPPQQAYQAPQQPVYPPQQQVYQAPPQQTYQPQQAYQMPQQPVYQAPQQMAGAFYGAPVAAPKKKKGGAVVAIIAAVLVIAVAAVALFVWPGFLKGKGSINIEGKEPDEAYRLVSKRNTDEIADSAVTYYKTALTESPLIGGGKDELTADITVSEDMASLLRSMAGVDMDWLQKLTVGFNFNEKGSEMGGDLVLKVNGTDLLGGSFYLDTEKGKAFAKINEFSDKYVEFDLDDYLDDLRSDDGEFILDVLRDALPDEKTVEKLIDRYSAVLRESVEKDMAEKEKGTLSRAGVKEEGTWLTVTLSEDDMADIALKVLREVKNDDDVYKIVSSFGKAAGEELSKSDFKDEIDSLIEEIEDEGVEAGEIVSKVFVAKNGDVHGREILIDGEKILEYAYPQSEGKFGFELKIYADPGDEEPGVLLTGSGKRTGDLITGDFSLEADGEEIFSFSTENFDAEQFKNGRLKGVVSFEMPSVGSSGISSVLSAFSFQIDADFDMKNGGKLKVAVLAGEEDEKKEMITIDLSSKKSSSPSIKVVSSGLEADEYTSSIDSDKARKTIADRLKKAGAPAELTESLLDD